MLSFSFPSSTHLCPSRLSVMFIRRILEFEICRPIRRYQTLVALESLQIYLFLTAFCLLKDAVKSYDWLAKIILQLFDQVSHLLHPSPTACMSSNWTQVLIFSWVFLWTAVWVWHYQKIQYKLYSKEVVVKIYYK